MTRRISHPDSGDRIVKRRSKRQQLRTPVTPDSQNVVGPDTVLDPVDEDPIRSSSSRDPREGYLASTISSMLGRRSPRDPVVSSPYSGTSHETSSWSTGLAELEGDTAAGAETSSHSHEDYASQFEADTQAAIQESLHPVLHRQPTTDEEDLRTAIENSKRHIIK